MNYTGHLAFGIDTYKYISNHIDNKDIFLTACVAPDIAIPENLTKSKAHFRDKSDKLYSAPDIDIFLKKYANRLNEDFVLGVFCHLYADMVFSTIYMPYIAKPLDKNYNFYNKKDAVFIKLRKQNKIIPAAKFLNENKIYDDYTKSTHTLIKAFNIPLNINFSTKDPHIFEIDANKLKNIPGEVSKYTVIPKTNEDTTLLDLDEYTKFIKIYSKEFSEFYNDILTKKN